MCSYQGNYGQFPWTRRIVLTWGIFAEVCFFLDFRRIMIETSLRQGVPGALMIQMQTGFTIGSCASHRWSRGVRSPTSLVFTSLWCQSRRRQSRRSCAELRGHQPLRGLLGRWRRQTSTAQRSLVLDSAWAGKRTVLPSAAQCSLWCIFNYNAGLSVQGEPVGYVI